MRITQLGCQIGYFQQKAGIVEPTHGEQGQQTTPRFGDFSLQCSIAPHGITGLAVWRNRVGDHRPIGGRPSIDRCYRTCHRCMNRRTLSKLPRSRSNCREGRSTTRGSLGQPPQAARSDSPACGNASSAHQSQRPRMAPSPTRQSVAEARTWRATRAGQESWPPWAQKQPERCWSVRSKHLGQGWHGGHSHQKHPRAGS